MASLTSALSALLAVCCAFLSRRTTLFPRAPPTLSAHVLFKKKSMTQLLDKSRSNGSASSRAWVDATHEQDWNACQPRTCLSQARIAGTLAGLDIDPGFSGRQ